MSGLSAQAKSNLAFLQRECDKVEARILAYERAAYDEVFESMNPIGARDAAEGLCDEMSAEVAAGLRAVDERLDELNDRLNEIEAIVNEEIRLLGQQREQHARDYNAKRKSVNSGNVVKGFWPLYAGLFLCVICALLAREMGLGMIGSVAGGVVGYAAGFYIMKYLSGRLLRGANAAASPEAQAALDAIHEEYERTTDKMNALQDRVREIEKNDDVIGELQDLVQDALDDFEE